MNKRRRLTGTVKSNKMDKTVIVEVSRTYQHPLYKKVVRSMKAYKAHDEIGSNVGDKVVIVESAPISKTVTWVVESIVKFEIRQETTEAVAEAIEKAEELAAEEAEELAAEEMEELAAEEMEELAAEDVEETVVIFEDAIEEEVTVIIVDEEGAA